MMSKRCEESTFSSYKPAFGVSKGSSGVAVPSAVLHSLNLPGSQYFSVSLQLTFHIVLHTFILQKELKTNQFVVLQAKGGVMCLVMLVLYKLKM
jgi:hypothetical protein